ncbi:MAG: cyclic nucleotide-binding domain-containing protein [Rhodobacterales bacterium]|nr:cyclic nucleotide-binding domain-containing protein [Rhodobacterales bacterium]
MDLAVLLALLAGLFVLIGLAEPLALRLGVPLSVILALLGVAIGAGASFFWYTPLTDALNPLALVILTLPIGSQVFLYVLLPILIFQVALTLNLRRMADDWVPILVLAVVAVGLAVTENPAVPPEIKRQVGVLATGFTLFTLLVQGTTLRWVIGRLGLDRLSPRDRALSDQVVAVALQKVREAVAQTARDLGLTRSLVRDEAKRFAERLDAAVARAEAGQGIQDADRVTLGMLALAGRERDLVLEAFRDRLIPAALADRILVDADRLIEDTLARGRAGYRAAARAALRAGRAGRLAQALHNRLRWSRPLARVTADRFARLVAQGLILPRLHGFIDSRILRIHGRRVADLLHDLVNRRAEDVARELGALRLQYPGYAEELERALIRRTTLQLEDREYDELVRDGLIGPELHRALSADLAQRRAALTRLPPLDLTLQKTALVDRFPLFAGMDDTARRALTAALRTVYVNPGAVILQRDDHPHSVWFIAQGAVEAVQAGTRTMLGPGEMFGHVALLMRHPRRAQVTAVTPCTLLELQETPFLAAIRRDPDLARHVRDTAARRGVQIDEAALTAPPAAARGPGARLAAALGRILARGRPAG